MGEGCGRWGAGLRGEHRSVRGMGDKSFFTRIGLMIIIRIELGLGIALESKMILGGIKIRDRGRYAI